MVYFCNPRGGQGYGEAHAKAIYHGKWGTVDFKDLMVWADTMEKHAYIDPTNMFVTGGSYGGYMTVWIIGHTDRFKAAVSQRCVSNLLSMWGSSDFNWSFQEIFDDHAPFENLDVLWEFAGRTNMTFFGTSAAFLIACMNNKLEPGRKHNLKRLRAVGSTGSPLSPEGYRWVYEAVKKDILLGSVSGGTDPCSAFVGCCPILPIRAGDLQCRCLVSAQVSNA